MAQVPAVERAGGCLALGPQSSWLQEKQRGYLGTTQEIKTLPVARVVATSHPFSQKKVKATGWKDK